MSTAWALASALYKREVSALEVLTKRVEDDQLGSIYPFTIRPNSYWEKRTEEIKEVNINIFQKNKISKNRAEVLYPKQKC